VPDEAIKGDLKMFDKYEEHIRDSAQDNSRFDGFDRGDLGNDDVDGNIEETVIGRMSCYHGKVEVVEVAMGMDTDYYVRVNGRMVTEFMDRERALRVGRWWVNGAAA
jgi:hypothetical protein